MKLYKAGNLWWLASIVLMLTLACSTSSTQREKPADKTIEYPTPATDTQVDSLKKVLDGKRKKPDQ